MFMFYVFPSSLVPVTKRRTKTTRKSRKKRRKRKTRRGRRTKNIRRARRERRVKRARTVRRARRRRVRRKNGGVIALPAAALLAPATVQVLPRARSEAVSESVNATSSSGVKPK